MSFCASKTGHSSGHFGTSGENIFVSLSGCKRVREYSFEWVNKSVRLNHEEHMEELEGPCWMRRVICCLRGISDSLSLHVGVKGFRF